MNKYVGIGAAAALAVLLASIWIARPATDRPSTGALVAPAATPTAAPAGTLAAAERAFDFGSISMARGTVRHRFAVANSGESPVTVARLYTSCMCTTATLIIGERTFGPYGMPGHGAIPEIGAVIAPGQEAAVEVVFDPAAHGPAGVGKIQRAVRLETGLGTRLEFGFSAFVTP